MKTIIIPSSPVKPYEKGQAIPIKQVGKAYQFHNPKKNDLVVLCSDQDLETFGGVVLHSTSYPELVGQSNPEGKKYSEIKWAADNFVEFHGKIVMEFE